MRIVLISALALCACTATASAQALNDVVNKIQSEEAEIQDERSLHQNDLSNVDSAVEEITSGGSTAEGTFDTITIGEPSEAQDEAARKKLAAGRADLVNRFPEFGGHRLGRR
jgi:predicted aconitase